MIIVRWVTDRSIEVHEDGEMGGIVGEYPVQNIALLRDLAECNVIELQEIPMEGADDKV